MYGGAEAALGAALDGPPEDAIVATKIWAHVARGGTRAVRRQLEWYGGHVEIEQIHNLVLGGSISSGCEPSRTPAASASSGSRTTRRSAFGELADALRTTRFEVLQVPYNPWERECERSCSPLAEELGVAVIAMRPLGGSGEDGGGAIELTDAQKSELGVESWAEALLVGARRRAHRLGRSRRRRARSARRSNARAGGGARFTAGAARARRAARSVEDATVSTRLSSSSPRR